MSQIQNILINIALKTLPLSQKGFGMPLLCGVTERKVKYELDVLEGTAGLKWKAVNTGEQNIQVNYVVSGNSTPLSVVRSGAGTQISPYLITVNVETDVSGDPTSTAAEIKTAAEAVANVAGASAIVTVSLLETPGDGVVEAFTALWLVDPTSAYLEITDPDELLDASVGYLSTDPEYKQAGAIFSQSPRMAKIAIMKLDSFSTIADELADLRNGGKDGWYWLIITSRLKADIISASTYINTLEKIGIFGASDQTVLDALANAERSVVMISNHAEEFPEAAMLGRCGAVDIGSITWDSKQLNSQKNSDVTQSEQTTILEKNGNVIREMGGVDVTWEGKTMSGQYIDIINGRDYLKARLTESYHTLKINNNKIPMTLRGLDMIEASLREVFRDCGRRGVIATVDDAKDGEKSDMGDYQYILNLPETITDIPTNDRANRKASPVTFSATVGGGINKIEISGEMGV